MTKNKIRILALPALVSLSHSAVAVEQNTPPLSSEECITQKLTKAVKTAETSIPDLVEKLDLLTIKSDFLHHPEESSERLVEEVSQDKSPTGFTQSVLRILGDKSGKYLGGAADGYFTEAVYPRLLKLSEEYNLTDADRTSIRNAFDRMETYSRGESDLVKKYSNAFWGSLVNGQKLDQLVTKSDFLHHTRESAESLVEEVAQAKSPAEFTHSVLRILGTKSGKYLGGVADELFAKEVYPRLLKLSEMHNLTDADRASIRNIYDRMDTSSKDESELVEKYSNTFWGSLADGQTIDQLVVTSGFLNHTRESADSLIEEVAQAKSPTEFTQSVLRVLGTKSGKYLGGVADGYFAEAVYPRLLKLSEEYSLTDSDRSSIRNAFDRMKTYSRAETDLVKKYSNTFWGSLADGQKIDQLVVTSGFLNHTRESADSLIEEVAQAKSPAEFTHSVLRILGTKSGKYLGGVADGYFAGAVYPRLLTLSEKYNLTDADRASIRNAFDRMKTYSRTETDLVKKYSNTFWGSLVNGQKLDQLVTKSNFLNHTRESADSLIEEIAQSKSPAEFTKSVLRVLGAKSGKYMGGVADEQFAKEVYPRLLKLSEEYNLTDADRASIRSAFDRMDTSPKAEIELVRKYSNAFWGSVANGQKLDQLVTKSDFLNHTRESAESLVEEVAQAKSPTEFTQSVLRVLGTKSGKYMGGVADEQFAKEVYPRLLKLSAKYHLTDADRASIRYAFDRMDTSPKAEGELVRKYSNYFWGSIEN